MNDSVERCEHCHQAMPTIYKRALHSAVALSLLTLAERRHNEWTHMPSFIAGLEDFPAKLRATMRGDYAKLRFWGLLEEMDGRKADGNPHQGYWRCTPAGLSFAKGELAVPRYAVVTANSTLLQLTGEDVHMDDALGDLFSYSNLFKQGRT